LTRHKALNRGKKCHDDEEQTVLLHLDVSPVAVYDVVVVVVVVFALVSFIVSL
jgi:hypothetical protein